MYVKNDYGLATQIKYFTRQWFVIGIVVTIFYSIFIRINCKILKNSRILDIEGFTHLAVRYPQNHVFTKHLFICVYVLKIVQGFVWMPKNGIKKIFSDS